MQLSKPSINSDSLRPELSDLLDLSDDLASTFSVFINAQGDLGISSLTNEIHQLVVPSRAFSLMVFSSGRTCAAVCIFHHVTNDVDLF